MMAALPTALPTITKGAKRLVRASVRDGTRPGDLLRPQEAHFPGEIADFQSMLDYAVQQGWVEEVSRNGSDYRLTEGGFAAAQTAD
jgi:hypothetical protein